MKNRSRQTKHDPPRLPRYSPGILGPGLALIDRTYRYGQKVEISADIGFSDYAFSKRGRAELASLKRELGEPDTGFTHPGGGIYAGLPACPKEREDEIVARLLAIVEEPANLQLKAASSEAAA